MLGKLNGNSSHTPGSNHCTSPVPSRPFARTWETWETIDMSMDCRSHVQTHNHPFMLSRNISTLPHEALIHQVSGPGHHGSSRSPASPCASLPRVVLRPQWLTHRPPACPIPCRRENPSLVPTECRCPPDSRHSMRQEHHLTQNVGTEEFLQQKTTTYYHNIPQVPSWWTKFGPFRRYNRDQ